MAFTIDFDEDLIYVPFPFRISSQLLDALLFNLRRQHRTKSILPKPHCFVAYVYPKLMQKVLYISKRKWDPNIPHHLKEDDIRARLKVTKGAALCPAQNRQRDPCPLKIVLV